jgi:hypothetical protein
MPIATVANSLFLFLLAGLCEIGGGWLVWQWLREGRGLSWGLFGGAILILYVSSQPSSRPTSDVFMRPTVDFSLSCRFCGVGFLTATGRIGSI